MPFSKHAMLSRRQLMLAGSAAFATASLPVTRVLADTPPLRNFRLETGTSSHVQLAPDPHPQTRVWAYNGSVPGPEIRVQQGDRLRIAVRNGLPEETTAHWHGLRVPIAMDGVPHLTQTPIAPGETFNYEFDVPDAGTYWYHPHQRSFEQVGRGLYGPLIIEERNPVQVDRDLTWVLDDWRLERDAQIAGDFGNRHDAAHNGRVGNTVTINGRVAEAFAVRRGERVRLRLINAANARNFALRFADHEPWIIALDGQPVTPHRPTDGLVVLGSAMRADLIIDMIGAPGRRYTITDPFYPRLEYRLIDLVYTDSTLREKPLESEIALAANTMPEPDLEIARRHEIRFNGGMMGGMMMGGGSSRDEMMKMMRNGKMWLINGVAATGHVMDPLVTLKKDRSYILDMRNDTAWHHPIHLHGHSFRVISRNGQPTTYREWRDTVLMAPRERVEIAFVADNPGDWMFHCHVLGHQATGMMGIVRVQEGGTRS